MCAIFINEGAHSMRVWCATKIEYCTIRSFAHFSLCITCDFKIYWNEKSLNNQEQLIVWKDCEFYPGVQNRFLES